MKVCFLGLENLPVLAPEYRRHTIGGESVQQTLLARGAARAGYDVSMVVGDYGQADGATWHGVRTFKAYRPDAGVPLLRFIHPRWTGLWTALKRADAGLYYTSCAGMHVGLLALFCRRFNKKFVFRTASDTDCDSSRLLVRYARDRWLYANGLRRANAILVQSARQEETLARCFGLTSRVAGMLVERPEECRGDRDIDVLWVSNIRRVKRPDRILDLARNLPGRAFHIVGGSLPGEQALFDEVKRAASTIRNVVFHGRLSYWEANELYARARLLVNTSDVEGFPNSYLQAWIRGVPVLAFLDPDDVIERRGLGIACSSPADMSRQTRWLLTDRAAWQAASNRCRAHMDREYAEDKVIAAYLETFERLREGKAASAGMPSSAKARHV